MQTRLIDRCVGFTFEDVPAKGRGLIASREFARREVIIASPVLVFEGAEAAAIQETNLRNYVFWWPYNRDGALDAHSERIAVVMGYGSFANHSSTPNCEWDFIPETRQHLIRASRYIMPGEELSINYGWTEEQMQQLVTPAVTSARSFLQDIFRGVLS